MIRKLNALLSDFSSEWGRRMRRKRYKNLGEVQIDNTLFDLLRWYKERLKKRKDLTTQIPYAQTVEIEKLQTNRTKTSITWIGHSTFFIQINGLNILTDPVWSKRMGLQRRLTKPGIPIQQLPPIDIVFISHGHYDHLDFLTIMKLPGNPFFYVPVGLKPLFKRRGFNQVVEANWYDSFPLEKNKLIFHFVPAQHWTKRSLFDTNTSHWGGWIISDQLYGDSIYFVGDTGYFQGFKEIGERYQPNIVLMPIGAYEPEWFMKKAHIKPEDAVTAFLELKGQLFIPMHYGAFRLADDTGPEALEKLTNEWKRRKLDQNRLKILAIGETYWLSKD